MKITNASRDVVAVSGRTLNYTTETAALMWTGSRWLLLSAHNPA